MKFKSKLAILALTGGAIIGLTDLGKNVSTGCETYQGYRDYSADGERMFVFDEKSMYERVEGPDYPLFGNPEMYEDLEIGDKYRLEIRDPLIGPDRLLSFEKCENGGYRL